MGEHSGPSGRLRKEGFYNFKKTCSPGLCWVRGCSKKCKSKHSLCHMHYQRRWRAKNKLISDFCTLRDHAKERKLEFSITLDYWMGLTDAYCFYQVRESDDVLTIDRVDPTKGYIPGNLRVVTHSFNASKSTRERYLPEHVQAILERKRAQAQETNEKYLACDPEWTDDIPRDDAEGQRPEDDLDNCPF